MKEHKGTCFSFVAIILRRVLPSSADGPAVRPYLSEAGRSGVFSQVGPDRRAGRMARVEDGPAVRPYLGEAGRSGFFSR